VAEDVEVAVVGLYFEVGLVGAIPLVEQLFDHVDMLSYAEADGALIGFAAAVTLHLQAQRHGVSRIAPLGWKAGPVRAIEKGKKKRTNGFVWKTASPN
jgi:hypothetical protein